ncbi:E3 ubiquitin-protein ligase makorin-1-like [Galendromus occidentalis]|uniref:RING-type E3 ubiquitin transferase n=1 Tax=Galendromus occidentalis TaxID=34638 RepID=A0AAJ7L3N0_9ACAR|nr:E3 ubiquitin-protein ligase makorin-1-like [Galendromus occidentalis]
MGQEPEQQNKKYRELNERLMEVKEYESDEISLLEFQRVGATPDYRTLAISAIKAAPSDQTLISELLVSEDPAKFCPKYCKAVPDQDISIFLSVIPWNQKKMASFSPRSVLCRFIRSNECRYGASCRFSHDGTSETVAVCRYFQRGDCRYGERCRYRHVSEDSSCPPSSSAQSIETPVESPLEASALCEFHVISGVCRNRDCKATHGDICDLCCKYVLHSNDPDLKKRHLTECRRTQEERGESAAAIEPSSELQCGICLDVVTAKEAESSRIFGILEECPHVFCLDCIKEWRRSVSVSVTAARGCPECRTESHLVIPSAYFVGKGERKATLVEGYKTALSKRICKFFDQGRGACPFASRCLSRHVLPNGELEPKDAVPVHGPENEEPWLRVPLADGSTMIVIGFEVFIIPAPGQSEDSAREYNPL